MPEPITTVGLGAIAAYLGKDGIAKILGPTAEYLGGELQEFTKKRMNNVGQIFSNAEKKLGDKVEQPGAIPPKVLKTVINEGSYSEDQIAVEYFGGVLASSRTELSRDDRGARIAKALDILSCYQLRAHYLIYSSLSHLFKNKGQSLRMNEQRDKLEMFIPFDGFANAMGLTQKEWDNPQLLTHIFQGLNSDGLISDRWAFGPVDTLKTMSSSPLITLPGIVCTPTSSGAELFLWGFGSGNQDLDYIFTNDFSAKVDGTPELIQGALATKT
ncbi:hypothetical protein [Shewanella pealeana]|uniref:DUF4393 domain-containing protein n=1 Tax=Shewanella pealeana (strain ATCC 700345 / ANG-SQ1) TaxID=398579 RepID=A8H4J7_SHEPA|nr:hypothetical protein [Shewanella pealeana]ABV87484.1 conserved hypothetical protein [Shewanella pealeana ATCC 700345]